ncbi:sporulation membrane protein YtaF [Natranaerobius thermophilus]|uniref:Sporulation protein YtaF n=1 Tax=Natranaerobius thermophilus (strain ATCC BAA-1301 / DSM 18059 / JW/NM-WN-LF) TaxID=457570 RepID=B2A644_NATTJ|nr:sporulation membrane protein YtaF [Natranaerobius thermophilus]ACB85461.1 sporulation protein YtaF [Natranaerobius thermophilus JW/NM-WN-LF]
MPELFPLVALSLAVSLDGLAAGFAYGLKNIKIPLSSLLLLSVTSAISIAISMFFGRIVADLISPGIAEIMGGVILVVLGFWFIIQNLAITSKAYHQEENDQADRKNIIENVMDDPIKADLDSSGVISLKEAIILGIALAMDAFSAGFAASLMGFHSIITPFFVGLCKFIFVPMGVNFGFNLFSKVDRSKVAFLPGIILIMLGLLNFF